MNCRLCGNQRHELVLDLGCQSLGGQFPKPEHPDPLKYDLHLMRCKDCDLVQLKHSVPPAQMFSKYWYRSGVTDTMRKHLGDVAWEARQMWAGGEMPRVLDIGCNDETLLNHFTCETWGIDPCIENRPRRVRGYFPEHRERLDGPFDLIFSIAMFYDVELPVYFAKEVAARLAPGGLWCIEVAHLPTMLQTVAYDTICHEHLTYWSGCTLADCMWRAGLKIVRASVNKCNGGSIRVYATHQDCKLYDPAKWVRETADDLSGDCYAAVHCPGVELAWKQPRALTTFAMEVHARANDLTERIFNLRRDGKRIALLGASTKVNTILQFCELNGTIIQHASERDPNKWGRVTPGTRIPIISEEESRRQKPDYYLVGPWHFASEIMEREKGVGLIFPISAEFAGCCTAVSA